MYRGSSKIPKLRIHRNLFLCLVGEHSNRSEGVPVRDFGAFGRENVDMSNHNPNEKLEPRKS